MLLQHQLSPLISLLLTILAAYALSRGPFPADQQLRRRGHLAAAPKKLHVVDHVTICKACVTRIILGFIDRCTGSLCHVCLQLTAK